MKPEKVEMYYHKDTDTTWVNAKNWEERHKTEVISYGSVNLRTEDFEFVQETMHNLGFHQITENPFRILNYATEVLEEDSIAEE